jgi:hypothetical protein
MLTDIERKRLRELYSLIETTNASPEEFEEYKALKAKDGEQPCFVFGSNEAGIHGGGAAKAAREKHGAVLHQGFGPQGNSFAIPTCARPTGEKNCGISFSKVKYYVACFLLFAGAHPEREFQVTQVGCGLAGWTKDEIAPLFEDAPENCWFDTEWREFLGDSCTVNGRTFNRKYWGHIG